ncbi:type III secretion system stalk subunit SctO [Desulfothermus sp.]
MKYVLEDLLLLRERRVDAARADVKIKEKKLQEARDLIKKKKEELANYIKWRRDTEDNLYEQIKNQLVSQADLDDLRRTISILREREYAYIKAIENAKKEEKQRIKELEEARNTLKDAIKNCEKIKEHKQIWLKEKLKELERIQDLEMEEFKTKKIELEEENVY